MMLLAVDTSTAQLGLAIYDGVQVIAETIWQSRQRHTTQLVPAVSELMQRTGVQMSDVQGVGVAIGPGSFTALRVGVAFVKGLALSRKLAIVGIPTLEILAAAQVPSRLPLVALLQAGRGRIAVEHFRPAMTQRGDESAWISQGPAEITTADALADSIDTPTLVVGELTAGERQRLIRKKVNVVLTSPAMSVRRPAILAQIAWKRWQEGRVDEPASLAPVYLQLPQPAAT
jgi:tRNA threonylcarbamoyladenosine biosynthesis protein TsaB